MKVTQNDIIIFNNLYYKTHNYAEVARQTGFSAATVRKYVDKNYVLVNKEDKVIFSATLSKEPPQLLVEADTWGQYCTLTNDEKEKLKELWKELEI